MVEVPHPFRFGIQVTEAADADAWADLARRAEALEYDVLAMPDHVSDQFAYAPALAAACATTRLHIGTLVLAIDFRQPATVAGEAATLDLLSGGRYELDLGVGGSLLDDYRLLDLPFAPPGIRVGRFTESLTAIKGLFGAEPVTLAGRHVRLNGLVGFPRPVQRPHPPILIGARGLRMLALAAREADIVSVLVGMSPAGEFDLRDVRAAALDAKVALLRAAAGDRFARLELHLLVQQLAIGDDAPQVGGALGERWHLTPEEVAETPYALIGTVGEIVAQLVARRRRFGLSYYTVRDRDMATFAPVLAALAGH